MTKMGRPKNKIPTYPVCLRLPMRIVRWLRREGNKKKFIKFAEKDLRKDEDE